MSAYLPPPTPLFSFAGQVEQFVTNLGVVNSINGEKISEVTAAQADPSGLDPAHPRTRALDSGTHVLAGQTSFWSAGHGESGPAVDGGP